MVVKRVAMKVRALGWVANGDSDCTFSGKAPHGTPQTQNTMPMAMTNLHHTHTMTPPWPCHPQIIPSTSADVSS